MERLRRGRRATARMRRRPGRQVASGAILLLLAATPACVSVRYASQRVFQEPEHLREARILREGTELTRCLELLGAPVDVQEEEDGDGLVVITWAWDEATGWGAGLSIPLNDFNASFNYDRDARQPHLLRMRFDGDWRLVDVLRD